MARKTIDQIYSTLNDMSEALQGLVKDAKELASSVVDYEGEINRVMKEQLEKYFIPAVENLDEDTETPGSIIGMVRFLQSVPLAMVLPEIEGSYFENPEIDEEAINMPMESLVGDDIETANADEEDDEEKLDFDALVANTDVDDDDEEVEEEPSMAQKIEDLPRNTSYATTHNEKPEEKVEAPKVNESYNKYTVVRKNGVGSALGDLANLEDTEVAQFDTKEEAELRATELNDNLTPEEKDFLKTSYDVVENTFGED